MSIKGLPRNIQALLITQMLFNVGFYLVVPFLAIQLTHELGATSTIVGLVLGIRTFSQQGLFFLGGGLTDRFGAKPVLLTGVAIRVLGFLIAGFATSVAVLTIGVILIGFAAALFSPAVEATLAAEGARLEAAGVVTRTRIFALDAAWSRIGSLSGPVLGAVLIPVGFSLVCSVGAAIFAAVWVAHAVIAPSTRPDSSSVQEDQPADSAGLVATWSIVLHNRTFLGFALLYSTYLAAYNQQYLALPVELRRATGSDQALGTFFAIAGFYVVLCQGWVHRMTSVWSSTRALRVGFGLMAASFGAVAACAPFSFNGWARYIPAVIFTLLLHLGIMIAVPIARDLVGHIAGNRHLGSYFGFLNSFGGLMVLIASLVVGTLLGRAEQPGLTAIWPWLFMTIILALSAWGLSAQARSISARKQTADVSSPMPTS